MRSIAADIVSYETIRLWCLKFRPEYARKLRSKHRGYYECKPSTLVQVFTVRSPFLLPRLTDTLRLELKPTAKQLFLDDYVIKRVHNLRRVLHQPAKIVPEPVISPEHSWENVTVGTRNTPYWDSGEKVWKLYYHGTAMESDDVGQSRLTYRQCLAISKDGLYWTKPNLGLIEWNESKENNIVASSGNFLYHVIHDVNGGNERYKGLFGMSGRKSAVSPDGLNWRFLDAPVIPSQDQSKLNYDELAGEYLLTVKHEGPYGRSVYLTTSKNFREWSKPRLIFHADGEDQEASRRRIAARLTDARYAPLTVNRPLAAPRSLPDVDGDRLSGEGG